MNGHSIMEACFHSFPFVTFSPLHAVLHHALCTRGAERSWPRLPLLLRGLVTISRQLGGNLSRSNLKPRSDTLLFSGGTAPFENGVICYTAPVAPLSCPAV